MGINDRCAVGTCKNARKYRDKYIIKPHIAAYNTSLELKFWRCTNPKLYSKWTNACNRKNFKFGKNNYICSNHFQYGRPTSVNPVPTLFLKGYDDIETTPKRKAPMSREFVTPKMKRQKKITKVETISHKIPGETSSTHTIVSPTADVLKSFETTVSIPSDNTPISSPTKVLSNLSLSPPSAVATPPTTNMSDFKIHNPKNKNNQSIIRRRMYWKIIEGDNRLVKFYTGCPTAKIFMFVVDHVRAKHQKVQYFRGAQSYNETAKKYQLSPVKAFCQRKPGPSRSLTLEDEILMTLMRIRLDAPEEDLAFRFCISQSYVSRIITTFILFLGLELQPFIYWPTPDETLSYKHPHFGGTFNKCEGIGDCTEQWLQHSKNTGAQYQSYSTYKSTNTVKKLIFCTKAGSISYVSPGYGGLATDRYIVEGTNISSKFTPGFMAMFDKGFNVQDLFLAKQVKCEIPPFLRSKRSFTRSEVYHGKRISRARIHIERVMGRLKEFRLLKNSLPINMIDMCDHIWTIAAAIVNLQPPLVTVNNEIR